MLFALYYAGALAILAAHVSGTLARRNLNVLIYLLVLTVLPAVLYL